MKFNALVFIDLMLWFLSALVFIDVLTPANHSQIQHKALRTLFNL